MQVTLTFLSRGKLPTSGHIKDRNTHHSSTLRNTGVHIDNAFVTLPSLKTTINELRLDAEKATLEIGAIIADPRGMKNTTVNDVRLIDIQGDCHASIEQVFLQHGNRNATSNESLVVGIEGLALKTSQEELNDMAQSLNEFGQSIADLVTSWMPQRSSSSNDHEQNTSRMIHLNGFRIDAQLEMPGWMPNFNGTIKISPITVNTSNPDATGFIQDHIMGAIRKQYVRNLFRWS